MTDWIVMCRVSGGVTGTREAPLKGENREIKYFTSESEAQAEAARLMSITRNSLVSFRYWAEPHNSWSEAW